MKPYRGEIFEGIEIETGPIGIHTVYVATEKTLDSFYQSFREWDEKMVRSGAVVAKYYYATEGEEPSVFVFFPNDCSEYDQDGILRELKPPAWELCRNKLEYLVFKNVLVSKNQDLQQT